MALRSIILIVFTIITLLFSNINCYAQMVPIPTTEKKATEEPAKVELTKEPVLYKDTVIMYIGSSDLVSAKYRTLNIKTTISKILQDDQDPDNVSIKEEGNDFKIYIGNKLLTEITPEDSVVNNQDSEKLAQIWKSNLENLIKSEYKKEGKVDIYQEIGIMFILLIIVLIVLELFKKKISKIIVFILLKAMQHFNLFLDQLRNKKIQEFTESKSEKEIESLMASKKEQEEKLEDKIDKISKEINFVNTILIRLVQTIAIIAFIIYTLFVLPQTYEYVNELAIFTLSVTSIATDAFTQWISDAKTWEGLGRVIFICIISAFIIYIMSIISSGIENIVQIALEDDQGRARRIKTISKVIKTTIKILIVCFALMLVLSELGIDITPIIAGVSIIGLAVSFGSQSLVKDIINGTFILLENQFRIGDVVTIGGTGGLVEDMTLRVTVLRDLSGNVHIIPNGNITTVTVSTKEWSRAHLNIGIAYKEDIDNASRIIKETGDQLFKEFPDKILSETTILGVNDLGDSSVDIKMIMTTQPGEQWFVEREFRRRIKYAFDENNIEIPFPHRTLYVHKEEN